MVLPKTHPAFPRSYCFRKSAIDLAKDQSQYFAHWLMSETPMVLPRNHLGSSQNSKFEAIFPGLQIQTKSILCTLANEPNPMVLPRTPLGSSQNSKSEVICPELETQTKSILCTLAYEPNPYGSSQNSPWFIPDLNF